MLYICNKEYNFGVLKYPSMGFYYFKDIATFPSYWLDVKIILKPSWYELVLYTTVLDCLVQVYHECCELSFEINCGVTPAFPNCQELIIVSTVLHNLLQACWQDYKKIMSHILFYHFYMHYNCFQVQFPKVFLF